MYHTLSKVRYTVDIVQHLKLDSCTVTKEILLSQRISVGRSRKSADRQKKRDGRTFGKLLERTIIVAHRMMSPRLQNAGVSTFNGSASWWRTGCSVPFDAREGETRLNTGRKMGNTSRSVMSMLFIHSPALVAGTSAETEIAKDSRSASHLPGQRG